MLEPGAASTRLVVSSDRIHQAHVRTRIVHLIAFESSLSIEVRKEGNLILLYSTIFLKETLISAFTPDLDDLFAILAFIILVISFNNYIPFIFWKDLTDRFNTFIKFFE